MREKDAVSNVFFKDPARVADLLNGYIYHGQQVVKAENVQNLGERVYRVKGKYGKVKAEELTLDVVSEVIQQMQVSIVCLQNQSDVHYAMPVRVMNEEVITIVVYWGKEPWDGPRHLKEILKLEKCPLELQKFIVDYPIHLLEVRQYANSEAFMTDIKYVFGFLQRDKDKEELSAYVEGNKNIFSGLKESTYNLLSVMSRCSRLKQVKKEVEKEGAYDMCEAIEGIYEDGKREGKREGQQLGHRQGRRQGRREGRQEGRLLGQREGSVKMLLLILSKLGEVSGELEKKIRCEKDLNTLETWSRWALDAKSMEEFLQGM